MRKQSWRNLLVGTAAVVGVLVAGAVVPQAAKAETILLASGLSAPFLQYPMSVDGGFMEKHGIDAEYKMFPSGFEATVAVGAGEAHVANTDCPTVLKAKANGANFLLVARNVLNPKELKLAVAEGIQGPEDLKGKKVGVLKTSSVDWYASKYFNAFGLEEGSGPDQVETINIAAPEWIPALQRGDIVGFFGWEPWLAKVVEIVDGAHIIHRASDNNLYVLNNCLVFNTDWVQQDPETAKKVMAAWIETHDAMMADLPKAVALASGPMRIPEDELMGMTDGFIYRVEFTQDFLDHVTEAAVWLESKDLLEPGQGEQIIQELAYPDLLRSVAPERVDVQRQ